MRLPRNILRMARSDGLYWGDCRATSCGWLAVTWRFEARSDVFNYSSLRTFAKQRSEAIFLSVSSLRTFAKQRSVAICWSVSSLRTFPVGKEVWQSVCCLTRGLISWDCRATSYGWLAVTW